MDTTTIILIPINTALLLTGVFGFGRTVQKLDDLKEFAGRLDRRVEHMERAHTSASQTGPTAHPTVLVEYVEELGTGDGSESEGENGDRSV